MQMKRVSVDDEDGDSTSNVEALAEKVCRFFLKVIHPPKGIECRMLFLSHTISTIPP